MSVPYTIYYGIRKEREVPYRVWNLERTHPNFRFVQPSPYGHKLTFERTEVHHIVGYLYIILCHLRAHAHA